MMLREDYYVFEKPETSWYSSAWFKALIRFLDVERFISFVWLSFLFSQSVIFAFLDSSGDKKTVSFETLPLLLLKSRISSFIALTTRLEHRNFWLLILFYLSSILLSWIWLLDAVLSGENTIPVFVELWVVFSCLCCLGEVACIALARIRLLSIVLCTSISLAFWFLLT